MDAIANPFSPGAGSPPPELAGRDAVLQQARILLQRARLGRAEKSMLLTGLRGVGKTVLLNEIRHRALTEKFPTIYLEAHDGKSLGQLLAPELSLLLLELDRMAGAGDKVKRGLAVLRSFINSIEVKVNDFSLGLDISPEKGVADSGNLEIDLPNLFMAVAEAAQERNTVVALFIDELQSFSVSELGALIMTMHRMQQRLLPVVLFGAGLPILPALAGDSRSYAERLFNFPEIGALSQEDVTRALQEPAQEAGAEFEQAALSEIYERTQGYPYFVQEWGYHCWNLACASPISRDTVKTATEKVTQSLDKSFFRVRFDRLTPREKNFLRAMAGLGAGPYRIGVIAETLGVKVTSLGPLRAQLIRKGMIYSPTHGELAFTVPLFDRFMARAITEHMV